MPNSSSIFISYRIADTRIQARLLFKTLDDLFPGQVFYDKSSLEPGMKWPRELEEKAPRGQSGAPALRQPHPLDGRQHGRLWPGQPQDRRSGRLGP